VKRNLRRVLVAMLLFVGVYMGIAVYTGVGRIRASLELFHTEAFAAACGLAFGNYVLRFLKWEFYLARLGIRGVPKLDSFLTFLSGFVLTVTPGKVGEVFKSVVLHQTHDVPITKTAPIVVAERATDVLGIVALIAFGSLGFSGGLLWAGIGMALVLVLLVIVGHEGISMHLIGLVGRLPGRLGAIAPKLEAAYGSLKTMLHPRNLLVPTLLSMVAWLLECLALWVILRGFGAPTAIPLATFFYATSTLIGAIVPVPGGLGVTESALMGQMTELGHVDAGIATAAMILVRFATLWFAVLVGFVALSWMKRRHPGLLRDDPAEAVTGSRAAP